MKRPYTPEQRAQIQAPLEAGEAYREVQRERAEAIRRVMAEIARLRAEGVFPPDDLPPA